MARQVMFLFVLLATFGAREETQAQVAGSHPQPTPHGIKAPPVSGRVARAQLTVVNPPRSVIHCPVQENFSGAITTNGAAEVRYTWVSFDGGTWPEEILRFSGPGTQRVSRQVTLGGMGQTVHGWLQLKVLSPNILLSPRAQYSFRCPVPPRGAR